MMERFCQKWLASFQRLSQQDRAGTGAGTGLGEHTVLAWTSFVLTYSLAGVAVICRTVWMRQRGKFLTRMSCRSDCCSNASRCRSRVPVRV